VGVVNSEAIEAEQALLSSILILPAALEEASAVLKPEHFYLPVHAAMYASACALHRQGTPVDRVTLINALSAHDGFDEKGGLHYVSSLANLSPNCYHALAHARIVRQHAAKRALAEYDQRVGALATDKGISVSEAKSQRRELLDAVDEGRIEDTEPHWFRDVVDRAVERYSQPTHGVTGLATGLEKIDEATAGLQNGDLIVIAARPSMGKSSMALTFAHHALVRVGIPVLFFSLEMNEEQLSDRIFALEARVPALSLKKRQLDDEQWERVMRAAATLHEIHLHAPTVSTLTVEDMRAECARYVRQYGVRLVIVDYLAMIRPTNPKDDERLQFSHATKELRRIGRDLEIPMVLLAQINRGGEGKMPQLSDLKSSGATEEDADVVILLYRPVVNDPQLPEEQRHLAEVWIAKNRQGPRPQFQVAYEEEYMHFLNLDWRQQPEEFRHTAPKLLATPQNDMGRIRQILEDGGAIPRRAS
jgi:replicative DNA helicase